MADKLKAEKRFVQAVEPHLIALHPLLDLVAVATSDRRVECFRFDGHIAFTVRLPVNTTVQQIGWTHHVSQEHFDSSAYHLAVASSDGKISFQTSAGDKLVHTKFFDVTWAQRVFRTAPMMQDNSAINFMASSTYFFAQAQKGFLNEANAFSNSRIGTHTHVGPGSISLGARGVLEWLSDYDSAKSTLNAMPKLNHLTTSNMDSNFGYWDSSIFANYKSSQVLLNRASSMLNFSLNMVFACSDRGNVFLTIEDTIPAGQYPLRAATSDESTSTIAHASHPHSSCNSFLTQRCDVNQNTELSLSLVSLGALKQHSVSPQVSVRMAQLIVAHAQYIGQVVIELRQRYQTMQRLPSRLIANIALTMQENGSSITLTDALILTIGGGNCLPVVREWLVDEVGLAQHRRWDADMDGGYTSIQLLLADALGPAIERMSDILGSFEAENEKHPEFLGHQIALWTQLGDRLDALRLLRADALRHARYEQNQFKLFSQWLLLQVQGQAAESGSATAAELLGRAGTIDQSQLLSYIEGPLLHSSLHAFLGGLTNSAFSAPGTNKVITLDELDSLVQTHALDPDADIAFPLNAFNLLSHANDLLELTQCAGLALSKAFQKEVDVLEDMVIERNACPGIGDIRLQVPQVLWPPSQYHDIRTDKSKMFEHYAEIFVLTVCQDDRRTLRVHRIEHREQPEIRHPTVDNGWIKKWGMVALTLGHGQIVDVKFVDDKRCMVLMKDENEFTLTQIFYRDGYGVLPDDGDGQQTFKLVTSPCHTYNGASLEQRHQAHYRDLAEYRPARYQNPRVCGFFNIVKFPHHNSVGDFVPANIQVDAVGGGGTARNVLVLNKEGTRYRVFGLD